MNTKGIFFDQITKKNLRDRSADLSDVRKRHIAEEGWDLGKNDIPLFIQSGLVSFYLIKQSDQAGESKIIGSISIFSDGHFAMIGSFMISASLRGQGLGQDSLSSMMDIHRPSSTALLSTPGREAFYKRNGFETVGFFSRLTFQTKKTNSVNLSISRITPFEVEKMLQFDKKYSGIKRETLLRGLADEPQNVTYVSFTDDFSVSGYGLLRALEQGYRISIYTHSAHYFEEIFGKIINHLLTSISIGEPILIAMDCPIAKEPLLMSRKFFQLKERYALMFKGTSDQLPLSLKGGPTWGILTEECA